jgi:hypothetical protein
MRFRPGVPPVPWAVVDTSWYTPVPQGAWRHGRSAPICYGWIGQQSGSGFRTLRDLHWEFLRLRTCFELSSSWHTLPAYGTHLNRNILDFMRWPQIDLGPQGLKDIQRPKPFQNNSCTSCQ